MPTWYYFSRPTHSTFHDLTTTKTPPQNLKQLLGLGLKFIVNPKYTNNSTYLSTSSLARLDRDLQIRTYYAGESPETEDDGEFNSKLYYRSSWTPPPWTKSKAITRRFNQFSDALKPLFKKTKGRSNLLPLQRRALQALQQQDDFLIVQCDKNLGPAIMQKEDYIATAFRDHLNDRSTYKYLTPVFAKWFAIKLKQDILSWLNTYKVSLPKTTVAFMKRKLEENTDPFGYLYLTMKVHKGDNPVKSRPIASASGSLLEPLGLVINHMLQPIAQKQRSYFKNSLELKQMLLAHNPFPANSYVGTADAQSMYTNIPTQQALRMIKEYLIKLNDPDINVHAIMSGLRLIMTCNVINFGDTCWQQVNGSAMGVSPAPPYATIYFGIHEERIQQEFTPNLLFYRRYIDDVIYVWTQTGDTLADQAAWHSFKQQMNACPGLTWDFSPLGRSVDFMDLTISLDGSNQVVTTLYEKKLNLHLYIPPNSAHPPGVLHGLIFGHIRRIFTLCTDEADRYTRTREMFKHLLARGYTGKALEPLFRGAIAKVTAAAPAAATPAATLTNAAPVFFHLRYHPQDPPSPAIQKLWRDLVSQPPYGMPLSRVQNHQGTRVGLDRLIVAYSRPLNLGNLLSYRKLDTGSGPPVSSYLDGESRDG